MSNGGLSKVRLGRMRDVMMGHVERGSVPGLVTLVHRRGETHVEALGLKTLGGEPMRRDTLFRIASMTKPVAAVAAMILVEECRLRLDDPVDRFLPELSNRRVLKRVDGPLEETVPAQRPISLRDLLTLRMGLGHIMEPSADWPIQQAVHGQQLLLGPPRPQTTPAPDEWISRVGSLPLMYQPGERWLYDLGLDVLGVLISRAVGQPLETFLRARLFEPLGMKDTGFSVPAEKLGRLATSYQPHANTGVLGLYDSADGQWSRPPAFESASGGLVSTVDDYLAFGRMLLDKGKHGRERILSRPSVELMTTAQLTAEQKAGTGIFFGDHSSWGFGVGIATRRNTLSGVPGQFGWAGGLGTLWNSDPQEDMVSILMTQVMMTSPTPPAVFQDFSTSAYQAIDD
jgi:CubicO group peptidase (beta-lactamase class C family)